jgi:uncharacterized RDD family membrane protein YckC
MENQFLDSTLDNTAPQYEYANFGQRLVALLIDGLIMGFVSFIVLGIFGASMFSVLKGNPDSESAAAGMVGSVMLLWLVLIVLNFAYFVYFESSEKQGTLGKQAMGLIVTDIYGERISAMNALGRRASKIVSAFFMLIGYLMQPFTEKRQALHDMMASTLVYKKF